MDSLIFDKSGKCFKCVMKMVEIIEKVDIYVLKGSQFISKMVIKYVCFVDGLILLIEGKCFKCGIGMVKIIEKVDI